MNILQDLTQTKAQLLLAISAIEEEKFNTVPFEGSWTAGQISDHLLKADDVSVLYAETLPSERPIDEKVHAISGIFLNFDLKLAPPARIIPPDTHQDKEIMLKVLGNVFDKLIEAANTLDLSAICTAWVIPAFGPLTRLEFLWLYNVHTIRHTRQLKKIAVALAKV
jgi:hypothetical protein